MVQSRHKNVMQTFMMNRPERWQHRFSSVWIFRHDWAAGIYCGKRMHGDIPSAEGTSKRTHRNISPVADERAPKTPRRSKRAVNGSSLGSVSVQTAFSANGIGFTANRIRTRMLSAVQQESHGCSEGTGMLLIQNLRCPAHK